MTIFLAIIIGAAFGFVLQRIGATNPQNIINMLRLKDLHLLKAIMLGVGTSSALLFVMLSAGFADAGHLSVKSSYLGVIVGGGILGLGFALAGYCPGTGLAAAGTGRKDAWFFVAGGLVGAAIYMAVYGAIKDGALFREIAGGKVTLAETGSKFASLMPDTSGLLVALVVAVVLVAVAVLAPARRGKNP
jgi:hypothetical protein